MISFPSYNPGDYEFEPKSISDDDLYSAIDEELNCDDDAVFVLNEDDEVCQFYGHEILPEGCETISREEAIEHLVKNRDTIPFDLA